MNRWVDLGYREIESRPPENSGKYRCYKFPREFLQGFLDRIQDGILAEVCTPWVLASLLSVVYGLQSADHEVTVPTTIPRTENWARRKCPVRAMHHGPAMAVVECQYTPGKRRHASIENTGFGMRHCVMKSVVTYTQPLQSSEHFIISLSQTSIHTLTLSVYGCWSLYRLVEQTPCTIFEHATWNLALDPLAPV